MPLGIAVNGTDLIINMGLFNDATGTQPSLLGSAGLGYMIGGTKWRRFNQH
jgi:hypothetical protein